MARIPINPSSVIAQGPQTRQLPSGAFGGGVAEAVSGIGQLGQNIATDIRQEELKAEQLRMQEAAEARKAADAAKRFTVVASAEDGLTDLRDKYAEGVRGGTIDKAKADELHRTEALKIVEKAAQDLPETPDRELVAARLRNSADRLGNDVRKAITDRDKHDATAGIQQTLEYAQRMYRTDPKKAEVIARGVIDSIGPGSSLSPEQLGKLHQGWKETTQFTAGYEAVSRARDSRKGLAEAEKLINSLPDLDTQRRATLIDRVQSYGMVLDQKAKEAARRAEAERDRMLRRAEHSASAFQLLADKGTALDPAYIDRAIKETAGTPYQAAIKAMADQARTTGGLAVQPVAVQQRALDQINAQIAQQGRSPELDKRREQIEKVVRGSQQDLEKDPLRAGLERGVITEWQPLNMAGGLAGLAPQIAARVDAADRVRRWAGRPVSPLTDEEAATVKQQLDALPAKEKSTAVVTLAAAVGPQQAQALAAQMDKKDKGLSLAFATAGMRTPEGRLTSELILRGQQARADGTSTKGVREPEVRASAWRARAAADLKGVYANAAFTTQVRDAAELIMHGIAAEQSGWLSERDMQRAVELAIGGTIVEHGGRRIPLPAGVDQNALNKRLRSVSVTEIGAQAMVPRADGNPQDLTKLTVRAAGVEIPVAEFVKTLPGQELMPVRMGEFAVMVGGRPVVNAAGKPITVKVN